MICILTLGSGCNEEKAEPEKTVSEAMTYRQLVRDYAERKGLSESDAEAGAAVMQLEGLSTENEKYRIVSLPETVEKENYLLWLVMITDESEKDWKIKSVESAWVEKVDDESQLYAGPVQYWIRGERQLEYVVNGDFYDRKGAVVSFRKTAGENNDGRIEIQAKLEGDYKSIGYADIHGDVKL